MINHAWVTLPDADISLNAILGCCIQRGLADGSCGQLAGFRPKGTDNASDAGVLGDDIFCVSALKDAYGYDGGAVLLRQRSSQLQQGAYTVAAAAAMASAPFSGSAPCALRPRNRMVKGLEAA